MKANQTPLDDIAGEAEIRQLVDAFYERIQADELLGPIFDERIEDWPTHLGIMYSFWGSILFGSKGYNGNPFAKHQPLPVERAHFVRWVELFEDTVDGLFAGPKAERAKEAAKTVAHSFQIRKGIYPFDEKGRFY